MQKKAKHKTNKKQNNIILNNIKKEEGYLVVVIRHQEIEETDYAPGTVPVPYRVLPGIIQGTGTCTWY